MGKQRMKVYKDKEFRDLLTSNGYRLNRYTGDHHIYVNATGRHVSVKFPVNPCIARRLIKEYNLITT